MVFNAIKFTGVKTLMSAQSKATPARTTPIASIHLAVTTANVQMDSDKQWIPKHAMTLMNAKNLDKRPCAENLDLATICLVDLIADVRKDSVESLASMLTNASRLIPVLTWPLAAILLAATPAPVQMGTKEMDEEK